MESKISRTKKVIAVLVLMMFIRVSYQKEASSSSSLIRKIEQNLLSKLGIKSRPIVDRKKIRVPEVMIGLYEKQMSHEHESTALPLPGRLTTYANTVRSYTHQDSPIDRRFVRNHKFRLNFDLAGFPETEVVTSTELKLTIVPSINRSREWSHHRVTVYDIVRPGIKGRTEPILRVTDTRIVETYTLLPHQQQTTYSRTLSLDVSPIVRRWLSDSGNNHGLLIDVQSPSGEAVSSPHVRLKRSTRSRHEDEHWDAVQPLLFVYSADRLAQQSSAFSRLHADGMGRRKRSGGAGQQSRRRARDECRRKQLWVDFEKVGWNDWIVAPPGYDAYYCAGECATQFGDHLNATNHAIVQSLVHSVHPHTIPKPCCVPTALTSISMLYLDEHNKAVLKNYPDMVVEGCGCR